MIDYYEPQLDLTLLGCGFLGSYHLGAIYLLSQIWPHKPYQRICGASCGGLLGGLLLAGVKLQHVLERAVQVQRLLRCWLKSPRQISSSTTIGDLVERSLEKLLPSNAHELCTDRLGLSVTRVSAPWTLENKFVSQFPTRRHLIDFIASGCFIPLWSGALLSAPIEGEHFIDGAYSNNFPRFPDSPRRVLELSPFAGEVEISPQDSTFLFKARVLGSIYMANWNNFIRCCHAMLPFNVESYKIYLISGHRDMKNYLLKHKLIKCRTCYQNVVSNQDFFSPSKSLINRNQCDTNNLACIFCLRLLEQVDSLRVPDDMLNQFHD